LHSDADAVALRVAARGRVEIRERPGPFVDPEDGPTGRAAPASRRFDQREGVVFVAPGAFVAERPERRAAKFTASALGVRPAQECDHVCAAASLHPQRADPALLRDANSRGGPVAGATGRGGDEQSCDRNRPAHEPQSHTLSRTTLARDGSVLPREPSRERGLARTGGRGRSRRLRRLRPGRMDDAAQGVRAGLPRRRFSSDARAGARTFLARGRDVARWDVEDERARAAADEIGARVAGSRQEALAADLLVTVTPGHEILLKEGSLRPGQHVSLMGADGPGKAEIAVGELARVRVFCDDWEQMSRNVIPEPRVRLFADDWEQASHNGDLAHAVEAGKITREDVTQLGDVLVGAAPGRQSPDDITIFDSTGLAIQDLAIALAAMEHAAMLDLPTLEL